MLITASIHTGNGHTQVDKFLRIIDLPGMNSKTFMKHVRIIGPTIEKVAWASCKEAASIEREITLKNVEELKKML